MRSVGPIDIEKYSGAVLPRARSVNWEFALLYSHVPVSVLLAVRSKYSRSNEYVPSAFSVNAIRMPGQSAQGVMPSNVAGSIKGTLAAECAKEKHPRTVAMAATNAIVNRRMIAPLGDRGKRPSKLRNATLFATGALKRVAEVEIMLTETDSLLRRRSEFPILSTCTYLISNSLGAMPARTRDRLAEYADDWAMQGVVAWDKWLPLVTRAGDLVGSLIQAKPGQVIMQPNVSVAESVLISTLDFSGKRNKIVYSDLEFPTIHYNWMAQRDRGARIELVKSSDGISVDTQALCDAIDETTLAVPISHVIFRSGYITDVKAVVEKAHRVGAMVFLDVYQSIGAVPIDVAALNVDAVVGGALKWLCGGPGVAFLYVRPDLYERLRPRLVGWFSHKRPFDFDMSGLDLASDAWRYAGGTPNPAALYAALSGLEIVNEIGVEAIRRRSLELTTLAANLAQEAGLRVNSPLDSSRRGGHVTIDFPNAQAASQELIRRRFLIDYRPKAGIRIAPHFYNTREEVTAALGEIRSIIEGR
jgi:kynureninase